MANNILDIIDAEIARLQKARALVGTETIVPALEKITPKPGTKRGPRSAEARARMAAAQKKRWAKQKKG